MIYENTGDKNRHAYPHALSNDKRHMERKSKSRDLTQAGIISVEIARTLDGLLRERVRRTPDAIAYRDYDRSTGKWRDLTWSQMDERITLWQAALSAEKLAPGDRVAIML
ncbi:MAG TPA: hypothetical protein VJ734_00750, partial [Nitrosospira sp.]|nr:hypothetical protein [Nitrosospira sp.]